MPALGGGLGGRAREAAPLARHQAAANSQRAPRGPAPDTPPETKNRFSWNVSVADGGGERDNPWISISRIALCRSAVETARKCREECLPC